MEAATASAQTGREITQEYNPAYAPYFQWHGRYAFLYGGAGSGKSVAAAQKTIIRTISEPGHRILCLRKVARTLRGSVFQLLRDTIRGCNLTPFFEISESRMEFRYKPNGNEIILAGLDDVEKLKSIQGITSAWYEETTEGTEDDIDQIDLRIRGATNHYKQITLTFNPISVNHWLKSRVESAIPQRDSLVLKTTYLDNHFIDEDYKRVLDHKAKVNPNYARIYRDGEWGLPDVSRPWVYAFNADKIQEVELKKDHPVYLSFDFNINPMTATAHQFQYMRWYNTIYEFKSENTGVAQFCDQILAHPIARQHLLVTGDASGRSRTATAGNKTNYQIIQQKLKLTGGQLRVPKKNPPLSQSRTLSNHIWSYHPNRAIHPRCEFTISDLQHVEGDDDDKTKPPSDDMAHLLDTTRYQDSTWLRHFVKDAERLIAAGKWPAE